MTRGDVTKYISVTFTVTRKLSYGKRLRSCDASDAKNGQDKSIALTPCEHHDDVLGLTIGGGYGSELNILLATWSEYSAGLPNHDFPGHFAAADDNSETALR